MRYIVTLAQPRLLSLTPVTLWTHHCCSHTPTMISLCLMVRMGEVWLTGDAIDIFQKKQSSSNKKMKAMRILIATKICLLYYAVFFLCVCVCFVF